jgi:hypothetical protein
MCKEGKGIRICFMYRMRFSRMSLGKGCENETAVIECKELRSKVLLKIATMDSEV